MHILPVEENKKGKKLYLEGSLLSFKLKKKERYIASAFSPAAYFRDVEDESRISLNMETFKLNMIVWDLVKEFNELLLVCSSYIFIWSTCNIP